MTLSIDSFINYPFLIIAGLGLLIFLFLLIIKVRHTTKISYIYFLVDACTVIGALYSYFSEKSIYFAFSVVISALLLLLYTIIKAFDNPEKREAKKAEKRAAELAANKSQDEVSQAMLDEVKEKYQKLSEINNDLISKLSSFFSSDKSMENFLDYCNELITEKVSADGCVILIADDYDNILAVKSFKGSFPPPYKLPGDLPHKPIRVETNLRFAQFPISGNIFGDIFTEGEASLVTDSVKDPRIFQNGPEDFLKCGSYIFAPIKQKTETIGVIALSRNPDKSPFIKEDFDSAVIISDAVSTAMKPLYSFLSYAEHTELNKGGSIASKYQKDMIPAKLPVLPSLSIGCFSNNMEGVCGDYYDVLVSRRDKISFIMADVAGKGMNSLIVMIMIRAILRLAVNTAQSASTIMSWTNYGICSEGTKIDHFASIALINYNATTKEAEISTCGNNPVLVYTSKDNSIKQISEPSEPLGVTKDTVFKDIKVSVNSGDILVTCTDGLLECLNENGVQYSIENLKKVIIKNSGANAKEISNKVKEDLKKHCGVAQQYDDQSLLVIKIQ